MQLTNQLYYSQRGTWLQLYGHQNSIQATFRKHQYIWLHYNCPSYMLIAFFYLVIHNLKGENSDANLWRAMTNQL